MLAKESRLNKKSDIIKTIRYGRRIRTPYVLIYIFNPDPVPPETRVTAVVGKKVHKLAVRRHKYQRWLRELSREVIKNMPPCNIVLVGLPALNTVTTKHVLEESLADSFKELQTLSND